MSLESLLARLQSGSVDTPDTSVIPHEVSAKPAPVLACTSDTRDTSKTTNASDQDDFIARSIPHEWHQWQHWSDDEVQACKQRTIIFMERGVPERQADDLACRLVRRDREVDDRRSCAECLAFADGTCVQGKQPVGGGGTEVLHRCGSFVHVNFLDQVK